MIYVIAVCPTNFVRLDTGGGRVSCIKAMILKMNWTDAAAECPRAHCGARLVVIDYIKKNNVIENYLSTLPAAGLLSVLYISCALACVLKVLSLNWLYIAS